ncbi:hypothetical protein JZ751_029148 [Albula glossodonta]|uniref:Uncharacterized protein n=1 Tax=Albula glossodonta TaxID=121402 RepID=A0A8T2PC87_9TELE|nr:hypothetical protein JZ751_029148 [Albula glossodonta]
MADGGAASQDESSGPESRMRTPSESSKGAVDSGTESTGNLPPTPFNSTLTIPDVQAARVSMVLSLSPWSQLVLSGKAEKLGSRYLLGASAWYAN